MEYQNAKIGIIVIVPNSVLNSVGNYILQKEKEKYVCVYVYV